MQTTTASPLVLPPSLAADLSKHARSEIAIGESGASVFRFDRQNGTTVYLKSRSVGATAARPLNDEAERLGWMHAVGLAVPAVLQYHEWKGHEYLLLTAVPGSDASNQRSPDKYDAIVSVLASGMRTLHATNISACPFDQSRATRVRAAEEMVRTGAVDESDFDEARKGRSAKDLLVELTSSAPPTESRSFTHGDYCLPNVLLVEDAAGGFRISGFVDCGNSGIADPYQDLALCARSVAHNFGTEWVPVLFARYGLDRVDEQKLAYYQLLDEFF